MYGGSEFLDAEVEVAAVHLDRRGEDAFDGATFAVFGAEGELVGGFGELAGEGRFAALDFDGAFFGAEGVQTWASEGGGVAFGFQAGSVGARLEWEREGNRGQQRGAKRRKRGGAAD